MSRSSVYIHRGLLYNTILLFILMLTHTLATQDKRAVTPPPTEGPDRTLQPCACSFPQHERRSYLTILGYDPKLRYPRFFDIFLLRCSSFIILVSPARAIIFIFSCRHFIPKPHALFLILFVCMKNALMCLVSGKALVLAMVCNTCCNIFISILEHNFVPACFAAVGSSGEALVIVITCNTCCNTFISILEHNVGSIDTFQ